MSGRLHWALLGLMVVAGALPAACGGETDTAYGPPDGIVGRQAPQPTATATSTSTTPTGDAGGTTPTGDSGGTVTVDSGGGTPTPDGGTTGACAVSWATQVFPMLESTGSGTCGSAACHANGGQQPTILDGNATGTYNALKAYTLLNGVGYITPGNTDPTKSSMECNLVTKQCGALPMPEAPGTLSATQTATIDTWIKCGAPLN